MTEHPTAHVAPAGDAAAPKTPVARLVAQERTLHSSPSMVLHRQVLTEDFSDLQLLPGQIIVRYPSGLKQAFPLHTQVGDLIASKEFPTGSHPFVGAMVNNDLHGLQDLVDTNVYSLQPVALDSTDGMLMYRRTLSFILALAAKRTFPQRRLVVGHSLGPSFYYRLGEEDESPSAEDVVKLEECMRSIVGADLPLVPRSVSWMEAVEYLRSVGERQAMLLVRQRNEPVIPVISCDEFVDLADGPHLASTGLLRVFALMKYAEGFLLRFPHTKEPTVMPPWEDHHQAILGVYNEYKH